MSLPNCHYQIVVTKLSLPNCHYQIDITKNPPIIIYFLDGGDEELYDPVALVYPLHTAPINCIAVSPIDGSIFATTAQDGVKHV